MDPPGGEGAAQGNREHRQLSKALDLSSRSSDLLSSEAGSPSHGITPVLSLPPAHNQPFALFSQQLHQSGILPICLVSATKALPETILSRESSAGTFALFSSLVKEHLSSVLGSDWPGH